MNPVGLLLPAVAVAGLTSSCAASGSSDAGPTPHDWLVMEVGAQTYQYDCDAPPSNEKNVAGIKTLGCNWPSSDPILELDFELKFAMPVHEQTFDLSSADANQVNVVAGMEDRTGTMFSIYSSWEYPTPGVSGPVMITAPGASGTVMVHSYDPASRHLDVSLVWAELPLATNVSSSYPNAPKTIRIPRSEVVR
jgi:hypothetical protein